MNLKLNLTSNGGRLRSTESYTPEGGILRYPIGFSIPYPLEFRPTKSTILHSSIHTARYQTETSKDNPLITSALVRTNETFAFTQPKIICEVWGKLEIIILIFIGSDYICPYSTNVTKYDNWRIIKNGTYMDT